jgi:ABC-2 type transport system ATP-binding protein
LLIRLQDLSHEYVTYQKTQGFLGSLKDFFHRQTERHTALEDISLTIEAGEMVGLLGPNGAGKTTIMKVLAGLLHPTRGRVDVLGYQPSKKSAQYLRQIGLVLGQKSQLTWDLPASETFAVLKAIYRIPAQDYQHRLSILLEMFQLGNLLHTPVRKLSLGERMKFELIAALLHNPRLLLLDEPTIGLDIASQRAVHTFLREINRTDQTTVIVTSHYAKDIEALADRVVILQKGHIQYDGALVQLLAAHQQQIKILRIETPSDLYHHPLNFSLVGEQSWECEVPEEKLNEILLTLAQEVPLMAVTTQDKSLEDVLYALYAPASVSEEDVEHASVS